MILLKEWIGSRQEKRGRRGESVRHKKRYFSDGSKSVDNFPTWRTGKLNIEAFHSFCDLVLVLGQLEINMPPEPIDFVDVEMFICSYAPKKAKNEA